MKIFLAGSTGRVGTTVIEELISAGHTVYAGARNPDNISVKNENVIPVQFDLHASSTEMAKSLDGMDAVYFTAGSRGKDLLQTDSFGAVKLMQATELAGIKRFILLSSVFANLPEKWNDPALINITNYNIAKFFADQWLMNMTHLDYTIIQPGNLQETEASGLIKTGVDYSQPNSIGNVAKVLASVVDKENTYKKIITMADGDQPIDVALNKI